MLLIRPKGASDVVVRIGESDADDHCRSSTEKMEVPLNTALIPISEETKISLKVCQKLRRTCSRNVAQQRWEVFCGGIETEVLRTKMKGSSEAGVFS